MFLLLAFFPVLAHAASVTHTSLSTDFFLKINAGKIQKIDLQSSVLRSFSCNTTVRPQEKVYEIMLCTKSGIPVPVRFYDRGSDNVIILGQGLPAPKESMNIYADMLASYNVILFDYRWNGQYESLLMKSLLRGRPVQQLLLDEQEEIQTVIDFVASHKNYKAVIGLGQCYSTFLFAKIQAQATKKGEKGPFTHLIFDSCWHSLRSLAEQICCDPWLPLSPQVGGAPSIIKAITNNRLFKCLTLRCAFALMNNVSIEPYMRSLNIPVLFIHGRNDLFVPKKHFDKIWHATNASSRLLLSTPYRHSSNLHNKTVYRFVTQRFVECSSTQEFEAMSVDIIPTLARDSI